jgi:hypothetical protein
LQAGGKRKVTLYGRQLPEGRAGAVKAVDGTVLEELDVEIDVPERRPGRVEGQSMVSAFDVEGFSFRLASPSGPSNPMFFALSQAAPILEPLHAPGKDTPGAADGAGRFTAPATLAGHFYPGGDVDTWSFEAKKGEVWRLEVISQRLGLSTNPFLLVQKNGLDVAEAWGPDADAGGLFLPMPLNDPTLRFEAKEDAVYAVHVRDLSGSNRANPTGAYVLSVRKEAPDFRLVATVIPPPEITAQVISAPYSALLRAGGTFAARVFAARKDGFAGEIELSAEGLPEGVSCEPTRILAGKNDGYVIFTAQEKPQPFIGPVRIVGKALIEGQPVSHQARCAVTRWPTANVNTTPVEDYLVQDFVLGVVTGEVAPLALTPKSESVREVAVGGKLEVALKVERRGEFKEALKLKTAGALGVEQVKEVEVDAKADSAKVVLDTAALKLPVGRHTVYFTALSKGKFRGKDVTTTFFSSPFAFEIK